VLHGVLLGRFVVMVGGMQRMTMRDFGMMRGLLVVAGLGMSGGFTMMLGGMLVMLGGLVMVIDVAVFAHGALPPYG
jgi:hypothetical protein